MRIKRKYQIQPSITFWGMCFSLMFAAQCTTSNYPSASQRPPTQRIDQEFAKNLVLPNEVHPTTYSWEDLLRQVPGVSVQGQGNFLSVRIRGAASLNLTTEPLFILNGVPLGHEFSCLARAATPQDVKSIYIVKGPEAALYGARGSNGVVVVTLTDR